MRYARGDLFRHRVCLDFLFLDTCSNLVLTEHTAGQQFFSPLVHGPSGTRSLLAVRFAAQLRRRHDLSSKPLITDSASSGQYPPHSETRSNQYPPIPTPGSDYSATPSSARSGSFPQDYLSRHHQYTPSSASMAQASSPSIPPSSGGRHPSHSHSNSDVPIDPSIAHQSSPTYPAPYSPYAPSDPMGYAQHAYAQWPGHHPYAMPYSSPGGPGSAGGSPATAGPPRPGQVS